jgi:predicted MPP superfamily phosphohydrolase
LAGRRAVHLTDLHLDRYQPRHDRIVATIGELRPDWIFITGDLLNVPEGLPHVFRFLAGLREIAPVFVTLGNHDHYSGVPIDQYCDLADRHKITLLINQATFIPTDFGEIAIVGVDDPSLHRADLSCLPPRAQDRFTLLLAHAPNILDQLEDHHVDLILCGHSHGGQWRIPGVPTFWLPRAAAADRGSITEAWSPALCQSWARMVVSSLRLNCTPEIACIEWVKED